MNEKLAPLINVLDFATDVFQHGGSYTVSVDPGFQNVEVKPAAIGSSLLPWMIAGVAGVVALVVLIGD